MEMTENGVAEPEKMASTHRAAYYPGLRTHHHIIMWKLLDSKGIQLDPREWEWQRKNR